MTKLLVSLPKFPPIPVSESSVRAPPVPVNVIFAAELPLSVIFAPVISVRFTLSRLMAFS